MHVLSSVEEDEQREIGARVAEARRFGGITQRELADRLGVTIRTIQNYEAGVAVPYRYLRTIEQLGHKRPGWILDDRSNVEITAAISSLHDAMERHNVLIQQYLGELREQRREDAARRAQPA